MLPEENHYQETDTKEIEFISSSCLGELKKKKKELYNVAPWGREFKFTVSWEDENVSKDGGVYIEREEDASVVPDLEAWK